VGGGDSAVEAATGLARQPGNHVTRSYRRSKLVCIRKRSAERIDPVLASGAMHGLFESQGESIEPPPHAFMRGVGIAFEGDEPLAASSAS
jgi:cation diffusion facilitator CzcD-associated flavoprotein CzcO